MQEKKIGNWNDDSKKRLQCTRKKMATQLLDKRSMLKILIGIFG